MKLFSYNVCPICVGVSGTWISMLGARFLGYSVDPTVLGILMGGSVVGIAYQLEKKIANENAKVLWKILFIPAGFVAVYGVVQSSWYVFLGALVFLPLLAYAFLKTPKQKEMSKTVADLEEKMKQCC